MNYLYAPQALGSPSNFRELKERQKIEAPIVFYLVKPKRNFFLISIYFDFSFSFYQKKGSFYTLSLSI